MTSIAGGLAAVHVPGLRLKIKWDGSTPVDESSRVISAGGSTAIDTVTRKPMPDSFHVTVDNKDQRFSSRNTASPIYAYLRIGKRCTLEMAWASGGSPAYDFLAAATIKDIKPHATAGTAEIEFIGTADRFTKSTCQLAPSANLRTDQVMSALLISAGFSAGTDYSLGTGTVTVQYAVAPPGTNLIDALIQLAQTENGRLWFDPANDGRLTFWNATTTAAAVSSPLATVTAAHYYDLDRELVPDGVVNQISKFEWTYPDYKDATGNWIDAPLFSNYAVAGGGGIPTPNCKANGGNGATGNTAGTGASTSGALGGTTRSGGNGHSGSSPTGGGGGSSAGTGANGTNASGQAGATAPSGGGNGGAGSTGFSIPGSPGINPGGGGGGGSNNSGAAGADGKVRVTWHPSGTVVTHSAAGTYVDIPPASTTTVDLECWGAGGGGDGQGAGQDAGGGGGGYSVRSGVALVGGPSVGSVVSVVGAGGTAGVSGIGAGNGGSTQATVGAASTAVPAGSVTTVAFTAGQGGQDSVATSTLWKTYVPVKWNPLIFDIIADRNDSFTSGTSVGVVLSPAVPSSSQVAYQPGGQNADGTFSITFTNNGTSAAFVRLRIRGHPASKAPVVMTSHDATSITNIGLFDNVVLGIPFTNAFKPNDTLAQAIVDREITRRKDPLDNTALPMDGIVAIAGSIIAATDQTIPGITVATETGQLFDNEWTFDTQAGFKSNIKLGPA